jgi:hypothetical protein
VTPPRPESCCAVLAPAASSRNPTAILISSSTASAEPRSGGTQSDDETVTFRASRFDRAFGATIYTLNLPDELAAHGSATSDLTRLCALVADGRLDPQVELEDSWREPAHAMDALLRRRIGGKAVLHVD